LGDSWRRGSVEKDDAARKTAKARWSGRLVDFWKAERKVSFWIIGNTGWIFSK
jgi:hypothetical protein